MRGLFARQYFQESYLAVLLTNQWGAESEDRADHTITSQDNINGYSHSVWVVFPLTFEKVVYSVVATKAAAVNSPGTRSYLKNKFILDHADWRKGHITHWIAIGV